VRWVCLSTVVVTNAMMYDLLEPLKLPGPRCNNGCAAWSTANSTVMGWWAHERQPNNASNHCAQLMNAPGLHPKNFKTKDHPYPLEDPTGTGSVGSWCLCQGNLTHPASNDFDYCVSAHYIPEQINIQIASPDTVVLSFVTFEPEPPSKSPQGRLGASPSTLQPIVTDAAVTHEYISLSGDRSYLMHYIVLRKLKHRARYYYQVKSGASEGPWSKVFSFRAPYASGTTNVAIFGDMGVYTWNNMANMRQDMYDEVIDLVVHVGDHAYDMGGNDDRRGDGYMAAYQEIIAEVPWLPVMGNHEFYDGDVLLSRYLNQTAGDVTAYPNKTSGDVVAYPPSHPLVATGHSTATSALGSILSRGNHHGAGSHGHVPSGTSRFYSVDFGLIHFVALDLNIYNAEDDCGEPCREAQLKWLKLDLAQANANRAAVPWIVAMSHFPLYCSNCPKPGHEPGDWWNSEECEFAGHDESCKVERSGPKPKPKPGPRHTDMVPDFEPLFMEHGVDMYACGHIHDYEYTYPIYNDTAVQRNHINPRAPIHLVSGNAGPPRPSTFRLTANWSYEHSRAFSYTRMTAYNSTTMRWAQVSNLNSSILTELIITQDKHGAFPIPPN